jgi:hypothetical protein
MTTRQIAPRKSNRDYRKEIPKPVRLEVFRRAGGLSLNGVHCEGCGLRLGGKRFDYDHTVAEVFRTVPKNQRPPITAADVKLLGYDCCHKGKSAGEHKANSHSKRIVAKMAYAEDSYSPLPFGRNSRLKKKCNGQIVDRETGEIVGGRR